MPTARPPVSRRRVLFGCAAVALLGVTAAGCGSTPSPPAVDDLEEQLTLAHRDSEMAAAAAPAADQAYAPALTVVAAERAAHARALAAEIARAAGTPTSSTETSSSTSTTAGSAPPPPPPSLQEVTAALHGSADSASQLAAKLSGYRAGLLGSIAASCATSVMVPLALTGQPQ
jgi:hypothetical protein